MNFPMEFPIFQFFYWFVDTVGIGGVVVTLAGGGSVALYALVMWWIHLGGAEATEAEVYTYPTPALHESHPD